MATGSPPIVWSPHAEQEFVDIWTFLAAEGSPAIADGQLRLIAGACERLGAWPLSGRPRDELIKGLRSVAIRPWVAYYRLSASAVEIVRVLHGHRDVDRIFAPPKDADR